MRLDTRGYLYKGPFFDAQGYHHRGPQPHWCAFLGIFSCSKMLTWFLASCSPPMHIMGVCLASESCGSTPRARPFLQNINAGTETLVRLDSVPPRFLCGSGFSLPVRPLPLSESSDLLACRCSLIVWHDSFAQHVVGPTLRHWASCQVRHTHVDTMRVVIAAVPRVGRIMHDAAIERSMLGHRSVTPTGRSQGCSEFDL